MLRECSTYGNSGSRRIDGVGTDRANRPRRQAKQERARETVDVILHAAARVLIDHGYAAATTNRIAKAAGVSVGTVYEYFANKEEVFDALIQRELDLLVSTIRCYTPTPGESLEETLAGLILKTMRAMRFGPELFRSLEHVPGAKFRNRLTEARQFAIDFVKQILEARRPDLDVEDVHLAAFVVVSAVEGVGANATTEILDECLARELVRLVSLYLTGGRTG